MTAGLATVIVAFVEDHECLEMPAMDRQRTRMDAGSDINYTLPIRYIP